MRYHAPDFLFCIIFSTFDFNSRFHSFIGVALVLALVEVRKSVAACGQAVGPILMLSYKNHALDEFLCDVLSFAQPPFRHGSLIRTGKAENAQLTSFGEKNSAFEKAAEAELVRRISVQRAALRVARTWLDLAQFYDTKAALYVRHH